MKTLSNKICPQCNIEFEYESWNKKRIYCSRKCKDTHMKGMRRTKEEWIIQAKENHGKKYIYDITDFDNKIDGKICIECPTHGAFWQDPGQHLLGKGCRKCANKSQFMTTQEFVNKGNKIHNSIYDYSLVEYENIKKHVKIICSKHGIFLQTPFQHLYHKTGCHTCAQHYTMSKGESDWLDSLNIPNNREHRQVILEFDGKKFIVDGKDGDIILEYLGDFWHGNPNLYSGSEINMLAKKSYGELYDETLHRFSIFEQQGYIVKYIWESEWLKK